MEPKVQWSIGEIERRLRHLLRYNPTKFWRLVRLVNSLGAEDGTQRPTKTTSG